MSLFFKETQADESKGSTVVGNKAGDRENGPGNTRQQETHHHQSDPAVVTLSGMHQGTNLFQYGTCPAGRVTYNFHSSYKPIHLSFKSVYNKEHKGVLCNTTSWRNFSQSTRPTGRVLWEELLVLSKFHS